MLSHIENGVEVLNNFLWGWPLVIFVVATSVLATILLKGVQFRYFFTSWRYVFVPEKNTSHDANTMSTFQAFINALSASIGNGSLAGMATAVFYGGPGAGFWIFVLGFFTLVIRFLEVLAGTYFVERTPAGTLRGGPMVYLARVPGGALLPAFYAFFCLLLSLIGGNAMQCNSIASGLERIIPTNVFIVAACLLAFVLYLLFGGAQRIAKVAEAIIPFKVGLFFIPTIILLCFHVTHLGAALHLIIASAFTSKAVLGGAMGYAVQDAIRRGMSRSLNATEIGLGTASILFGSTGTKSPVRTSIMSMVSAFISNHLVCFVLIVMFVATGAWQTGLNGTQMTQAAYETVFGAAGSWLVAFLTISFGMGVLVAYAFIGRECWNYLTNGRFGVIYNILFASMAFLGTLAKLKLVWDAIDVVNAGLIVINLYALLVLLKELRPVVLGYIKQDRE